jgi:hypothetical protein
MTVGQGTTCTAIATLYDGGVPGGSIQFSNTVNGVGTFGAESCQISPVQNSYFELSCSVSYSPVSTANPQVINAIYSGDLYHTASAAGFSIIINPSPQITSLQFTIGWVGGPGGQHDNLPVTDSGTVSVPLQASSCATATGTARSDSAQICITSISGSTYNFQVTNSQTSPQDIAVISVVGGSGAGLSQSGSFCISTEQKTCSGWSVTINSQGTNVTATANSSGFGPGQSLEPNDLDQNNYATIGVTVGGATGSGNNGNGNGNNPYEYMACNQQYLKQGQNTQCYSYTTFYDQHYPSGNVQFTMSPSGIGTFGPASCQVTQQSGGTYLMTCSVTFTAGSSSSGGQELTGFYPGDNYHNPCVAYYQLSLNQGNGNQAHVFAGNAVGMLLAAMSLLTVSSSNLGGALAVSVIGMTVGLPLMMQRSKLKTLLAHRTS